MTNGILSNTDEAYIIVASSNDFVKECVISLVHVYIIHNNGSRAEPCGIPQVTFL